MGLKSITAFITFLSAACLLRAASVKNHVVSMEIDADKFSSNTPALRLEPASLYPAPTVFTKGRGLPKAVGASAPSVAKNRNDGEFNVVIDLQKTVNTVGPRYVGVTLDSSVFRRRWQDFDVNSTTLHTLVKGLAPSLFRVGGSAADFFIFNTSDPRGEDFKDDYEDAGGDHGADYDYSDTGVDKPEIKNYTVTGEEWERLNYLVQVAGWDLIFDFNEFQRQDGQWDPNNARELLKFSQKHNYNIPFFQLGNEPNSYYHNFHFSIEPGQLAEDMQKLRSLLSEFPAYSRSYILGPDVTKVTEGSGRAYLQAFLQNGGQDVVSATTLHHYYFNAKSRGASLKDFINTTILDTLKDELSIGTNISHSLAPDLPVWLSETSSVSGGGLEGVSTAYVAGFMWLDKLGLSALYGLKAVLRQCLYNGNYALISQDFTPYPDYFLTLLYKRLVQGPVFNVTSSTDKVRVYANCANPSLYPRGALTVYVLNVKDKPTTVKFPQFSNQMYALYILTPGDEDGLKSAYVSLNGKKLELVGEDLPPTPALMRSGPVTFPAHSFGFVVIPQAEVGLCNSA